MTVNTHTKRPISARLAIEMSYLVPSEMGLFVCVFTVMSSIVEKEFAAFVLHNHRYMYLSNLCEKSHGEVGLNPKTPLVALI